MGTKKWGCRDANAHKCFMQVSRTFPWEKSPFYYIEYFERIQRKKEGMRCSHLFSSSFA